MRTGDQQRCPMLATLVVVCGIACIAGCRETIETPAQVEVETISPTSLVKQRPAVPSMDYVGSARCAECHQDIARRYAQHPMANSAGLTKTLSSQENLKDAHFAAGMFDYQVLSTDEGSVHQEVRRDSEGNTLYEQRVPMPYAIGSGQRGRAYVTLRDGLLFESPITWYSTDRRWDLSPGYAKQNQHFQRQIGDGCVFCHVGQPNSVHDETDRYAAPLFVEAGISCERCHGPGQAHITFHSARRASASATATASPADPIINPQKLPPEQRDAVCHQCHLQGDERILRYGRRHGDFRPGDHLHDIWISFTSGTKVIDGVSTEAVSQVEQMRSSLCFIASQGTFGCISCHDPHGIPDQTNSADHYRKRCLECHAEPQVECSEAITVRDAQGDSCIACHMPSLATSDVPHTSQTDHRVLRRPRGRTGSPSAETSTLQIFGSAEEQVPGWEIERARGLLMVEYAERERDRRLAAESLILLEPLVPQLSDDAPLLTRVGVAYDLANQPDRARLAWEAAITADGRLLEPRRRLALMMFDELNPAAARPALEAAYELNSWDEAICGRLILARAAQGESDQAFELARTSVTRFPASAQLHRWLAVAYQQRGQIAESERHLRQAERLEQAEATR